jgi:hypothetical protein
MWFFGGETGLDSILHPYLIKQPGNTGAANGKAPKRLPLFCPTVDRPQCYHIEVATEREDITIVGAKARTKIRAFSIFVNSSRNRK